MDCSSDSNLQELEELSASALMLEPESEISVDNVEPALDELPSDPTHPDPKNPALADSDDEPSLEIHFDEVAELSTPVSEPPPPSNADLTPVSFAHFEEEQATPDAGPSTDDLGDLSSTGELELDSSDDLTVKKRPSWNPPPDVFDDEEPDDDALTARRPSPVPPPPKASRPPVAPPEPSRLPFQSAPVLLRPFGRSAQLRRPTLPPPPRVPSFPASTDAVGAERKAQPNLRPLPRPSPLPPRSPSQPPIWPFAHSPSLPPIKPPPARPRLSLHGDAEATVNAPLQQRAIPTERVRLSALKRAPQDSPLPIPLQRARASTPEWDDSGSTARATLLPFGFAVDAVKHKLRRSSLPVVAGAAAGLALFLMTLLLLRAESVSSAGQGGPVLFVTVAGEGGRAIDDTRVFVDGMLRCTASPCRVSDVPKGMHFVSVAAEGFQTSAARVVQISEAEPTAIHVDLEPVQHGKSEETSIPVQALPSAPPPRTAAAAPTMATQSLGNALTKAPVAAPSPAPALGFGYLNLNSIPAANVVVDGKPLGSTPKVAVRVRAGSHDVMFVHPEHGRRNQSVFVSAGGKQTVAVRF